jgi:small-conductance mechanosensitive channel
MRWPRKATERAERDGDVAATDGHEAAATDSRSRLGGSLRLLRAEIVGFLLLLAAGIAVVAIRPTVLHDKQLSDVLLRGVVAVLIALLGWFGVRRIVHLTAREFARRTDPRAASSLVFLIKLGAVIGVIVAELFVVGVEPGALVVSGAVAAVIVALASQQLLGNIFAGSVLLASGIVVIGQTVRLQGGAIAGQAEGVIASIGLFHVRLTRSDGATMLIPNSVFQQLVIMPVADPASELERIAAKAYETRE